METFQTPDVEELRISSFLKEHEEEVKRAKDAVDQIISNQEHLHSLLEKSSSIFQGQGNYLGEVESEKKVVFVGDTHGAFDVTLYTLLRFLPDETVGKIVFLGDYVDRGEMSLENLILILREMVADQESSKGKLVVLRGNHESPLTNYHYGFYAELSKKVEGYPYEEFEKLFSLMPYAATINGYFSVHGGIAKDLNGDTISPQMKELASVNDLPKGDVEPSDPVAMQLLWNDPRECIDDFLPNVRGDGVYYFGRKAVEDFLKANDLKGIIRAHEVKDAFSCEMEGRVITVFSSRYHQMGAGVLIMDENRMFHVLKILGEKE